MKVMYYCQHVLGIGHFFRSMEVARAFERHQVLFVEGGEPVPGFVPPAHIRQAFLPALMMDREFKEMQTGGERLGQLQTERKHQLLGLYQQFQPDVLVIELFPFGRKKFGFELLPLLDTIRKDGSAMVVCSLRDILVEKTDQAKYEARVLKILNRYFDLLLVHSDPELIRLEETFERTSHITVPVVYTGFVTRRPPGLIRRVPKRIVASSGGGKVGVELLKCAIKAVRSLKDPEIRLRVFRGPFLEEEDMRSLLTLCADDPRIELRPFAKNFPRQLAMSELSVSMAGYNTCMDLIATRTKAIVHPFAQNREQALRAHRLSQYGFIQVVEQLESTRMAVLISDMLDQDLVPPIQLDLAIKGARNSVSTIEKYANTNYSKQTQVRSHYE